MYEYRLDFFQQTNGNVEACLVRLLEVCPLIKGSHRVLPHKLYNRAFLPSHSVILHFSDEACAKIAMCGAKVQETYLLAAVGDVPVYDDQRDAGAMPMSL